MAFHTNTPLGVLLLGHIYTHWHLASPWSLCLFIHQLCHCASTSSWERGGGVLGPTHTDLCVSHHIAVSMAHCGPLSFPVDVPFLISVTPFARCVVLSHWLFDVNVCFVVFALYLFTHHRHDTLAHSLF